MKYYKARTYGNPAVYEEVEVERESVNSVWIKGACLRKKTDHERYFKTLSELRKYRIDKINNKISMLEDDIAGLRNQLKIVESIPEN